MTYTKSQLEAQVQTLSETIHSFDVAHFQRTGLTQQWALDYREGLYNSLVAARKALAEAEEETVSEVNKFDLLLADKVRKAYDQGRLEGYARGYRVGHYRGYDQLDYDSSPPYSWDEPED